MVFPKQLRYSRSWILIVLQAAAEGSAFAPHPPYLNAHGLFREGLAWPGQLSLHCVKRHGTPVLQTLCSIAGSKTVWRENE